MFLILRRVVTTVATACCLAANPAGAAELRLFTFADYTSPELIGRFEKETGHKVTISTFPSYEEMLKAVRKNPSRYDLVVPAEYHVVELVQRGLLEKIDASKLPGFGNIEENWRGQYYDPNNDYSIPWHWGTTSFVVDSDSYGEAADSLKALFDPADGHRVGLLDDGDDVITMALRYLGLPRCNDTADGLAQVEALLMKRIDAVELFDADQPVEWLVKMTVPVSMAWNGDAMRARKLRPSLRYAYPREGVTVWTDTLVVLKGARSKAAALQFMAFMLRPENAAAQSNYTGYANAVHGSDAMLTPDLQDSPEIIIPPRAKLEFLQQCEESTYGRYRALWSKVKSARTGK